MSESRLLHRPRMELRQVKGFDVAVSGPPQGLASQEFRHHSDPLWTSKSNFRRRVRRLQSDARKLPLILCRVKVACLEYLDSYMLRCDSGVMHSCIGRLFMEQSVGANGLPAISTWHGKGMSNSYKFNVIPPSRRQ